MRKPIMGLKDLAKKVRIRLVYHRCLFEATELLKIPDIVLGQH